MLWSRDRRQRGPEQMVRPWVWPTQAELIGQICGPLDDDLRRSWGDLLVNLLWRVQDKRQKAARGSATALWFQWGAGGASAGLATFTGGTLLGHTQGLLATIIGGAAALIGVAAAGVIAVRPGSLYAVDFSRKASYEALWWQMRSYGLVDLPHAEPEVLKAKLDHFADELTKIMGGPPTPSPAQLT